MKLNETLLNETGQKIWILFHEREPRDDDEYLAFASDATMVEYIKKHMVGDIEDMPRPLESQLDLASLHDDKIGAGPSHETQLIDEYVAARKRDYKKAKTWRMFKDWIETYHPILLDDKIIRVEQTMLR